MSDWHLTQRISRMFKAHRAKRKKPQRSTFPSREWLLAYQRLVEMQGRLGERMNHNPMSPDLVAWGATYTPATVMPGDEYWRLVQADGPMDIGGNHHAYIDVWNRDAERIVGVPVQLFLADGTETFVSEPKPGEPAALSIPLYAGGHAYGVRVLDGRASDEIFGLGLGDRVPHHSFRLIFRLAIAEQVPTPTLLPPIIVEPDPPMTRREVEKIIEFYWNMLKGMP